MKLFLDQNLSFRMLKNLQGFFPGSRHVKDFGFTGDNDEDIWNFSAKNDFIIVSKDSDFLYRSLFRGHPPKTIHIQCGNSTPEFILNVILPISFLFRLFIRIIAIENSFDSRIIKNCMEEGRVELPTPTSSA